MIKIKVKNFGPIREGFLDQDGWMEIPKFTVFIGNQGSGKSTLAKVYSTFSWIEKALVRGDFDQKWLARKNRLKIKFLPYHRIESYLKETGPLEKRTEILYHGEAFLLEYKDAVLTASPVEEGSYKLPQLMYVPAERNFISYVRTPKDLKLSSDSLKEFLTEFENAKLELKGAIKLPVNKVDLEYDRLNDVLNLKTTEYKLRLSDSSSGFQSLVPLFLVSRYLANKVKASVEVKDSEPMSAKEMARFRKSIAEIFSNSSLTEDQKRAAIQVLADKFNKSAFINVVEEPEQNLFPASQWEMVKSIVEAAKYLEDSRLVITTHSPYILNWFSLAAMAAVTASKVENVPDLKDKLDDFFKPEHRVDADQLAFYEFNEETGQIRRLPTSEGIVSSNNYLNEYLKSANQILDQLFEIEEMLQ
ncbi:AAA family ATPase [Algoriphagus namhaensis]